MGKARNISKRNAIGISVVTLAALIIGIGIVWAIASANTKQVNTIQTGASAPSFKAVLPANTSIKDLGGWQKLTPPSGETVYVFVDEINGTVINVSQQSIPESFKSNPLGQIAELAKAYNATETFEAKGTTVYIGNSSKGPQSLIFTKNNLLILIKSQARIDNEAWISYINALN